MTDIRETLGNSMTTRPQDQIISDRDARQILRENSIELFDDPRSSVQFVTEVLVWMEAAAIQEGEAALVHERSRYVGETALAPATQATNLTANLEGEWKLSNFLF
jgi:hypothetical protein